jgi:hypothetical protein
MRVACGGPGALVAKECLDDAPRHAPLSEMGGIGVPERGHRGVFGEATLADHELQGLLEGGRRERRLLVPSGEQPGPRARTLPVCPHQLQGPFGQGPQAVFAPLALADTDQHALGVDVRDLPRRPFPEAQPTSLDHLQTHAGVRALYQGQQGAPFLRTQHDGQCLVVPGTDAREDWPRALPRALVEEPDPIEMDASRALRDLLVIDQVEEVRPHLSCADLIGSSPVVWREVFDGVKRALLSLGSQTAAWHVFAHPASARSHGHPPVRGASQGFTSPTRIRKRDGRSA